MPASTPRPSLGVAATGKRMIFTGPDAIRDYRTKLPEYTRYIGATTPAQGATADLEYLWRTAPWMTSILPHKHSYPGQIGWGVTEFSYLNRGNLLSGMQIKTGEFRQAAEDEITHRYQNPWQPPRNILDLQGCNTRGRLAWNCTDYNNFYHADSKWATMTRDSWSSRGSALPSLKQRPVHQNQTNSALHAPRDEGKQRMQ
ncbi:protein SPMIP2 isoform X3 [Chrysemys picta bellii]|uniref:protein SPMIP2 isoform X3 n=1 Tax=Chrysemys picta bellii TaxID=8478 RepID=UPI0032B20E7F